MVTPASREGHKAGARTPARPDVRLQVHGLPRRASRRRAGRADRPSRDRSVPVCGRRVERDRPRAVRRPRATGVPPGAGCGARRPRSADIDPERRDPGPHGDDRTKCFRPTGGSAAVSRSPPPASAQSSRWRAQRRSPRRSTASSDRVPIRRRWSGGTAGPGLAGRCCPRCRPTSERLGPGGCRSERGSCFHWARRAAGWRKRRPSPSSWPPKAPGSADPAGSGYAPQPKR